MQLEDLRNLYKNLNVTFKDDLTLKRAIIYYEVVKDAYTSLTSGPIKQELSKIVNGYERVAPALTHSTLLKGLCKILDRYTVPAVDQALKQANKTYKDYFTDLFQRYPASVETFLNTRKLTTIAFNILGTSFQRNVLTACKRILNDWAYLQHTFANPNCLFDKLIGIQSTGSDFHKGGQQVLILTFKVYPTGGSHQVVYKPSDLEVDCLIIGDSQAVNQFHDPPFQNASLMEILNELIEQNPDCGLERFPTYKILPMNAGTRLQADGNGNLPIRDSYGYIEYLEQYDEVSNSDFFGYNKGKSNFKIYDHQDREAICTRFGALLGQLAACAGIFSISDLHMENLIVHNYLPYMIDLENSLTRKVVMLNETEMLSGVTGAIDAVMVWSKKSAAKDDEKQIGELTTRKPRRNRLWAHPNRVISTKEYCGAAIRGFVRTMNLVHQALAEPSQQLLLAGWFQRLQKGAIVRVIPLETGKFSSSIDDAYRKCGDMNSFTAEIQKSMNQYIISKRAEWTKQPTETLPAFICLEADYLTGDFANFDIPVFYHKLDTCNVMTSEGKPIRVPQEIHQQLNRNTYFPGPPLLRVQNVQLMGLQDGSIYRARTEVFGLELERHMQSDVGRALIESIK
jgi:hypothetical protein